MTYVTYWTIINIVQKEVCILKLFLSWSGDLSRNVAIVFRDWIPSVIQSVEPYVSSEDIDKGTRWSSHIAGELSDSNYGIIVVTKENIKAPWINFEAGALSKQIEQSYVSPFLFNLKRSEVDGPLLQFQSTIYEKEDVKKLIESINKSLDSEALDQGRLDKVFDVWWPSLEESLNALLITHEGNTLESPGKSEDITHMSGILEELLELSRNQQKILHSPTSLIPPEYLQDILGYANKFDPGALDELRHLFNQMVHLVRSLEVSEDDSRIKTIELDRLFMRIDEVIMYLRTNRKRRLPAGKRSGDYVGI